MVGLRRGACQPFLFVTSDACKTIPFGTQVFFGQHLVDWSLVFSGMTLASLPLPIIYRLRSRQFIARLTAGPPWFEPVRGPLVDALVRDASAREVVDGARTWVDVAADWAAALD